MNGRPSSILIIILEHLADGDADFLSVLVVRGTVAGGPSAIQQNACCRRTRGRWRGLLPDPVKHRKSADIFFPRSAAAAGGRQSDWPNVSFQAETLIDKPRSWSPSGSPCRTIVPTLGERDSSYKDLAPFPPRRRSRIALICGSGTPAETPQADMAIALALLHGTATNAEG